MKQFPFIGNDEYLYDKTTNTLHYCKLLSDDCHIDHLTPNSSYLIPSNDKNLVLSLTIENKIKPIICPHCLKK